MNETQPNKQLSGFITAFASTLEKKPKFCAAMPAWKGFRNNLC